MKLKLNAHKMPHDISTRWNSTFDMLAFTLEYTAAVNDIVGNRVANLPQFELSDEEWWNAEQLHDTLKVGVCLYIFYGSSLANLAAQIFKDATLFLNMSHLSVLHLVLPRKCSTVITWLLTSWKCITWQCLCNFFQPSCISI